MQTPWTLHCTCYHSLMLSLAQDEHESGGERIDYVKRAAREGTTVVLLTYIRSSRSALSNAPSLQLNQSNDFPRVSYLQMQLHHYVYTQLYSAFHNSSCNNLACRVKAVYCVIDFPEPWIGHSRASSKPSLGRGALRPHPIISFRR